MNKSLFLLILLIWKFGHSQTSSCNNENFELIGTTYSVPQTLSINTTSGLTGWAVASGTNNGSPQNIFSCLQTGCCTDTSAYVVSAIGTNSLGYIDPTIGPAYPIYSVFGSTLNPGSSVNGFNCFGNWFIKINSAVAGAGITQISKSFVVNNSNAIFKYAFISVLQDGTPGSHCCCTNSGFSVKFKDCLGNALATSSGFTVAPDAGGSCSPLGPCTTGPIISFSNAAFTGWVYNKWRVDSVDLSMWLGNCVTAEFRAFDCAYSGHAGYAYIDAQCAPVVVNGINTPANHIYYKVYPNPASGNFNIEISKEITDGEIEVRNILGQVVLKQNVSQGKNSVKAESLAKGIYNYSVYNNKTIVSVGKVVIE